MQNIDGVINLMTQLTDIPEGYYRAFGYWGGQKQGGQHLIKDNRGLLRSISEHLGIDEVGLSVCAYKNNRPYLMFLPFDFDSADLNESGKEALILYNYFSEIGYDTHITFSGRKGFHVYISVKLKPYPKPQIKLCQKYFKDKLGLTTMDPALFGDIRRLMRIPYTYNLRGGRLCKEVSYSKGEELDLDDILLETNFEKYETKYEKKDFHPYPCIEKIIREDNEPRELIRMSYVALRLDKGWSEDEIVDEIESFNWIDFDEEKTRTKIHYIDQGNYNPLSCQSMDEHGWCPGKCEYGDIELMKKKVGLK